MGWAGLVTRVGPEMPLQQSEKGMGSYSGRKACDLSSRTSVLTREWGKVRAAVGPSPGQPLEAAGQETMKAKPGRPDWYS